MIIEVMNKKEKLEILNRYRQPDGTIVLPIGLSLNDWSKVNAKFFREDTLLEVVKDIEEEIQNIK